MACEQFGGPIRVSRDRSLHDSAKFGDQIAFSRRGWRRSTVVTQFLDLQHLPHPSQPHAVAARHQDVEEGMVKRDEATIEAPLKTRLQRRGSREMMECRDEARFPV